MKHLAMFVLVLAVLLAGHVVDLEASPAPAAPVDQVLLEAVPAIAAVAPELTELLPAAAPRAPPAWRVRTCTWDGGAADALASSAANWDTDVAPVAGDSIVFPTTTKSCTWDISLSLNTFTVNSGYVQTITQNSGANFNFSGAVAINGACTITCNAGATFTTASTFTMSTGTFNQGGAFSCTTFTIQTGSPVWVGSAATVTTGAVVYSNTAALTGTSGTWNAGGSWTRNNTATFTHNSGTVKFTAAATVNGAGGGAFNLVQVDSSASNGSVTFASTNTAAIPFGAAPNTTVGTGTMTVNCEATWSGAWTHIRSLVINNASSKMTGTGTPTLLIGGDLTLGASTTITNAIGTITFNGNATSSSLTDASDKLSATTTVCSKGSGVTFTVAASTICRFGLNPASSGIVAGGGVTVTGTLLYGGNWTHTGGLTLSAGGTITGTSTPTLNVSGNLNLSATGTITNTIGTVTFGGASTGTYTDTGAKLAASSFLVNKTGTGALTIAASTSLALGASPTVTQGSGAFTVTGTVTWTGTAAFSTTGTFTVSSGGVVTASSTPLLSLAGGISFDPAGTLTNTIPTITLTGAGSATITDTGDKLAGSIFDASGKTGGTTTIAASTTARFGASPTIHSVGSAGALTVSGVFSASGAVTSNVTGVFTIGATGSKSGAITSLTVNGNFTVSAGGTWGAIAMTATGAAATTVTDTGGASTGSWTINKTAGFAIAASTTVTLAGSNPSVVVNGGTNNFTVSGTCIWTGGLSITGSLVTNNGSTITGSSSPTITVSRSVTINATTTLTNPVSTLTFNGVASTNTHTDTSGVLSAAHVVVNCTGGNFSLAASTSASLGASPSVVVGSGAAFVCSGTATWSGTMTLSRSGGSGNILQTASTTTMTGTSTPKIILSDGGALIDAATTYTNVFDVTMIVSGGTGFAFSGAGKTYGAFVRTGAGDGATSFGGSNTFSSFSDNAASAAHSLIFTAGTTQTIGTWSSSQYMIDGGTGANIVTISSTSGGSAFTLAFPSGGKPINLRNCAISDMTTSGSEVWAGPYSTGTASGTLRIAINPRLRKQ